MAKDKETCPVCNGKCEMLCPACDGSGKQSREERAGLEKGWKSCARCGGKGKITCPKCHGKAAFNQRR